MVKYKYICPICGVTADLRDSVYKIKTKYEKTVNLGPYQVL